MALFGKRKPAERSAARAASLSSWASGHGWQYVDEFPPTRSVLLARGERNQIYDLVTGPLLPGLESQLFSFDFITSMVDNSGNRDYYHHPALAVRALPPQPLGLRYLSVEPAHAGKLGHLRDKLFGLRHHSAQQIEVDGLEDFHVWCLESDDVEFARQVLSPSTVATILGTGDDRAPLTFAASGSEAMVSAADLLLEPETTVDAEWLVTRAAPFLSAIAQIAKGGGGSSLAFTGPLVEPERPGQQAPKLTFKEAMLGPRAAAKVAGGVNVNKAVNVNVKRNFNIAVPATHAPAVKSALERWLAGHGAHAEIAEQPDGANVRLTFSAEGEDAPDITDPTVQAELQQVLASAIKPS